MKDNIINIAMWSYPRSTSTALLRSFSSRVDVHCTDEPFYGYFLKKSGLKHHLFQCRNVQTVLFGPKI